MNSIVKVMICLGIAILPMPNELALAQIPHNASNKKLIILQSSDYFDWAPDVAQNMASMQTNRPYINGVAFHVGPEYGFPNLAFNNEAWTEAGLKFPDLTTIASKKTTLTDNFILVWAHARNAPPDFFNDTVWNQINTNTVLLSKAVKTAGCKGVMFDAEFYSGGSTYSPWWYTKSNAHGTPPYGGKSFDTVKAKARQRGREYVEALQVHMPSITILTTFLYGYCWDYCYGNINNLPGSEYALLPAFADGMLEALNPRSILVDGNETAYYLEDSAEYINNNDGSYFHVREEATPRVCDPALLSKWNQQGQVAMPPYLDYCYNRYSPSAWNTATVQSKWMAHNIYHSLLATDQYVWTYVEGMNFWTGADAPAGVNVSADIEGAVTKFRSSQALGYDMYQSGTAAPQFITSPSITITSPANNTFLSSDGNITVTAGLGSNVGVSKVEFYANSFKIGEAISAPYTVTKPFLKADYLVFARVFKTDGTHHTSAPVNLIKSTTGIQTFRSYNNLPADGSSDLLTLANDGVRNLFKYAFNMLGTGEGQKDTLSIPNCAVLGQSGSAGLPSVGLDSSGKLTLSYIRRKATSNPGITYSPEFRTNATAWAVNSQAAEAIISIDALIERVTITDSFSAGSKRFARVRIVVL